MKKACIIALSALICSATVQAATYYTWVDEQGLTYYSATPPSGVDSSQVKTLQMNSGTKTSRSSTFAPATTPAPTPTPNTDQADSNAEEKADPAFKQQLADAEVTRKKNCETAKNNKVQLTLKNRIRLLTDDGTYRILSEEEKQQEIRMAEEAIDTYCK